MLGLKRIPAASHQQRPPHGAVNGTEGWSRQGGGGVGGGGVGRGLKLAAREKTGGDAGYRRTAQTPPAACLQECRVFDVCLMV